jgi:hypothetical protein
MKAIRYSVLILLWQPSLANADIIGCPGRVDHVLVEVGHENPYPYLLPPDIGANGETPQQEWFFPETRPKDASVTVHCFPQRNEEVKTDIAIPVEVESCTFFENHFSCKERD